MNKNYERWLNSEKIDEATRKELLSMSEEEIHDAFYKDMEFGTAGLRGIIGAGTNRINIYTVRKATQGYAEYLMDHEFRAVRRGVVIAYDNRRMSYEFALATAGVFAANGIKSYLFESLRPTPELSFAVRHLDCFAGVVITASHNPPEYNGYKIYDSHGCQLTPEYSDKVTICVNRIEDELSVPCLSLEEAGALIQVIGKEVDEAYYKAVKEIQVNPDLDKSDLKIVYSPQHGTGNVPVRKVLADLGYNVIPVYEQCEPDTEFSNTKSPNPESPLAYELPLKKAVENNADIVILTDPDCDRLGVAVLHEGEYKLMTGNQGGAVLLQYILSQKKEQGTLPENGLIFNTVVTSDLGDRVAEKYGVGVEKTLTGFKFIGDKIHNHKHSDGKIFLFGYEESYGYLIAPFVRDKDAVQSSLMLCEAAAFYKAQGKTLYDVLNDIYAEFGYYKDSLTSLTIPGEDGALRIKNILAELRSNPKSEVCGISVKEIQDFTTAEMIVKGFPKSNVLKYILEDGTWIAIRPSGTEPKCKFYYSIVAKDASEVEEKLLAIRKEFEPEV
ncbi:MAG: phospho-sugar mutase [Clostridia bacterium]|nr:phospho-sugar mutase [Clostridia bacterium]